MGDGSDYVQPYFTNFTTGPAFSFANWAELPTREKARNPTLRSVDLIEYA